MLSIASRVLVVLIAVVSVACASEESYTPHEEQGQMKKSGSRIPAPVVGSVTHDGVRYEQVKNGLLAGFDQMGGYLAAYDASSGDELWTLKVYENLRDGEREGDVQDVFFKSMSLRDDGKLLIENERGGKFVVDVEARTSSPQE